QKVAKDGGALQMSDLAQILPGGDYPPTKHEFLLELMRKFELCFAFDEDSKERVYLIPELLSKEQPLASTEFDNEENFRFRYTYDLMPEGLLPRFITRTHMLSEPAYRWRTGVILDWEGSRALVRADKQERQVNITIVGRGRSRPRLLAFVRENFEQI